MPHIYDCINKAHPMTGSLRRSFLHMVNIKVIP